MLSLQRGKCQDNLCFFVMCMFFTLTFGAFAQEDIKQTKTSPVSNQAVSKKIPCILDTDTGDDIDDTWALVFLLQCPELDVKLVTTSTGDTEFRAKMVAKTLQELGRTDIPIGIGKQTDKENLHKYFQRSWVDDYDVKSYPGTIYRDGVGAMIDTVMKSPEPVKIIAVGPLPNLAQAYRRQPDIVMNSEVIGMQGSIYTGYYGRSTPMPEWNVRTYIEDARLVFRAPWKMTITPLDTCGQIQITGEAYQNMLKSQSVAMQTVLEAYHHWLARPGHKPETRWDDKTCSTILYDTVAVYLAISTDYCQMENLGIKVDDKGSTIIDQNAKLVQCAVKWENEQAFMDMLIERMTTK